MSLEMIKPNLEQRFSLPLEDFYKRRIIFWHDDDKEFTDAIDELSIDNVKIVRLTGTNNFVIKKLLTVDDLESNYLVYNPIAYEKDEDNWLLDMELYSEVFRADYYSLKMDELHIDNTPKMRKALRVYSEFLKNEKRRVALRRMGRDYSEPLPLHMDMMAVLCGLKEGTAQDIIIAILSNSLDKDSNECLNQIEKFGNINAFWEIVRKYTGFVNDEDKTLTEFAAHILLTALSQTISESELKGLERFVTDSSRTFCYSLVREWIDDERKNALYNVARIIEEEYNLVNRFHKIELETLSKAGVFPAINEVILSRFFAEINEQVIRTDFILEVNGKRRTASWFDLTEDYYDCLYNIAKVEDFRREHINGFHIVEPKNICKLYTENVYKMDTYYRHFHLSFGHTLKNANLALGDLLKQCCEYVEGVYQNWYLKELNDCWHNAIESDMNTLGYISELPKQRNFYSKYVNSSAVKNSKVFVIISDAFRYEVAVQLMDKLIRETKGTATLESMQSVFPSITSFGMAALLPHRELSAVKNDNNVSAFVDGNPTDSKDKREKILQLANKKSIALRYKDLLRMKGNERREVTSGQEVVYIYHDAIDAIGDKAPTETKVFEACVTAIDEISTIVRMITNEMSGTNIFITADHGFLYTYKPLSDTQKVSTTTFDGDSYEVGRRYALTLRETKAEYLTKVDITNEIKGLDMMGYAPKDTTRIRKAGGGENYVHGGISIQELIVPVIVYKNLRATSKKFKEVENAEILLINESRKISNLIFSLDFLQKTPVGDKVKPCVYSLKFTDDEGNEVSDKHTVIADKSANSASERVYRVKFNLKSMEFDRDKIYRLIIANDTDVPTEVEYKIDIAFANDFDFDF